MIDLCGPIDHVFAQSFRRAATIDADDTTSILLRMKEDYDGAEPAPSSVAALNLPARVASEQDFADRGRLKDHHHGRN